MARILYSSTYGSDDPTRASLPFHMAMGAIEAGHQPEIALVAEATYLMKDTVAATIQGVGMPSLKELLAHAVEHNVPIHVWGGCGRARGVTEADLQPKNAQFITPKIYADLTVGADRVISF